MADALAMKNQAAPASLEAGRLKETSAENALSRIVHHLRHRRRRRD